MSTSRMNPPKKRKMQFHYSEVLAASPQHAISLKEVAYVHPPAVKEHSAPAGCSGQAEMCQTIEARLGWTGLSS